MKKLVLYLCDLSIGKGRRELQVRGIDVLSLWFILSLKKVRFYTHSEFILSIEKFMFYRNDLSFQEFFFFVFVIYPFNGGIGVLAWWFILSMKMMFYPYDLFCQWRNLWFIYLEISIHLRNGCFIFFIHLYVQRRNW